MKIEVIVNKRDLANNKKKMIRYANSLLARFSKEFKLDAEEHTPVDTGFAQSNWDLKQINKSKWILENRTKYIGALQAGHSAQAPNGIITEDTWKRIQRKLRRFKP